MDFDEKKCRTYLYALCRYDARSQCNFLMRHAKFQAINMIYNHTRHDLIEALVFHKRFAPIVCWALEMQS